MSAPTLPAAHTGAPAAPPAHPWDQAAEGWDRHSPMLAAWLQDSTAAMLDAAGVAPGARVLDVAAGAGEQTLEIARRVGHRGYVLATDISPRILELARHKLRRAGLADVATRVADAQALAGAVGPMDSTFDAAVSRLGLMFCTRPQLALAGMRAALRPGGRFAALVFGPPQGNPCIALMMATALRHLGREAPPAPAAGSLLSLGRPGLMAELLGAAGFAQVEVQAVAAPMRLPGVTHYVDFVRSAGLPITALLAPLPDTAQRDAWQDIAQQLDRFSTGAGWVGPNELLLCTATRPPTPKGRP